MYGRNHESKYYGSMVGSGLNVFAVWDYAIAKCKSGTVELNPKLVAFILGGPNQDIKPIQDALDFLCAPDLDSRSKAEEGRRMVKEGEYQYRLVNWHHYQAMRKAEDLTEYNRRMQTEHRAREKQKKMDKLRRSKPLIGEQKYLKAEADGASEETLNRMSEPK